MKWPMRQSTMCALLVLFAIVYYSCEKGEDYSDLHLQVPTQDALPEGNMLSYLDGNVFLDILPGAVTNPVCLNVNECHSGSNCDFILKTISIEPLMSFNVPVNVSLKYDGELANNEDSFDGCNLIIYFWDKLECFYNDGTRKTCCCYHNENDRTINFRITQTGVFAVGIKPQ